MVNNPKMSIVIPTLNEEKQLPLLLEKLVQLEDMEIIVSDGGSTDQTVPIAERFNVRVVHSTGGRGVQLNHGAESSTGEILLFLHADTDFEWRIFEDIHQAVKQGYLWGCCMLRFDNKGSFYRWVSFFSNLRSRFLSSCYGDQGIFCRREDFFLIGQFPDIPIMEDLEFSRKIRRKKRAVVIPGYVITSARRFQQVGPLRTLIKMQCLKILYRLGVPPAKLVGWYRPRMREDL